jgi:uncharacterized protein (DUF1778 family)
MRTTEPKETQIRIRLSQADKDRLYQAAVVLGVSVSDFIRSNALAVAKTTTSPNG